MPDFIKTAFKNDSFRIAFILTVLFFSAGIILMVTGINKYDEAIFIVLPIALGLSLGLLPEAGKMALGLKAGLICVCAILIVVQIEALLCIILSFFIIGPSIAAGSLISYFAKKRFKRKNDGRLSLLLLPLIFFINISFLKKLIYTAESQLMEISTERVFNSQSGTVFDAIKSMDTLSGPKPFLMGLGLPVPVKCILEGELEGGQRICHFNEGTIVERVTQFERGKILKMDVIECYLMINKWMHFQDAIYTFETTGDNMCKLTRITTYKSDLRPRLYWKIIERMAIQQEHKYVLNNLEAKLDK